MPLACLETRQVKNLDLDTFWPTLGDWNLGLRKFSSWPKWRKCPWKATGTRDVHPWAWGQIWDKHGKFENLRLTWRGLFFSTDPSQTSGDGLELDIGLVHMWDMWPNVPSLFGDPSSTKNLDLDTFWPSLGDWSRLESWTQGQKLPKTSKNCQVRVGFHLPRHGAPQNDCLGKAFYMGPLNDHLYPIWSHLTLFVWDYLIIIRFEFCFFELVNKYFEITTLWME